MDKQLKQFQQGLYAEICLTNLANMLLGNSCLLYPYEVYRTLYSYDEMKKYCEKNYCSKAIEIIDYIINKRYERVIHKIG